MNVQSIESNRRRNNHAVVIGARGHIDDAARDDSGLDGILLIDKPAGWTSHDVVAKARRITGQRRIGHTGTLDPMATGLLVLCLGQATRLVEYLTGHDKRYTGTIALGSGRTIAKRNVSAAQTPWTVRSDGSAA